MPDVRYYTGQPRETTHLPVEEFDNIAQDLNLNADFRLGYRLHLITDKVWYSDAGRHQYKAAFWPVIRSRMSQNRRGLAFEMYCLESRQIAIQLQPINNPFLETNLGLSDESLHTVTTRMNDYINAGSIEGAVAIATEMGVFPEDRVGQVQSIARRLNSNGVIRFAARAVINRASKPFYTSLVGQVLAQL